MLNQQQRDQQGYPTAEHTNALVDRMAHSIGFYAAHTYLRFQSITHTTREKFDQLDHLKAEQAKPSDQSTQPAELGSTEEPHLPATKKAEEMVDSLAQRLSVLTTVVKFNFQKTAAHVREDAEDMWAEAQVIRKHMH